MYIVSVYENGNLENYEYLSYNEALDAVERYRNMGLDVELWKED